MSYPADDHRPEGSDALPSDGTSNSPNEWRNEPAPGPAPGPAQYGTGDQYFADPHAADPYAAGGYGAQPYGEGQYPHPGQYPGQQFGTPQYGAPSYGMPSYGAQPYGPQSYGVPPYGGQPYGAQQYGAQQYGTQPYGVVQPYGQNPQAVRKDPTLMLVASFFIAGLGTILNGETGKGIGILAGYLVGAVLSVVLIGIPIMLAFWIWGLFDAYNGAKDYNARNGLL